MSTGAQRKKQEKTALGRVLNLAYAQCTDEEIEAVAIAELKLTPAKLKHIDFDKARTVGQALIRERIYEVATHSSKPSVKLLEVLARQHLGHSAHGIDDVVNEVLALRRALEKLHPDELAGETLETLGKKLGELKLVSGGRR